MNEIGNKIREIRKKKGFSQEELAELSKINLRTVQRIENNETDPRGATLNLICKVLEINIEDILDYGKTTDKNFLIYFHLSVLAFLAFPIGNIILPLTLWLTKKDKIVGLKEIGANLLNFQILWSIASFLSVTVYAFNKIMHYELVSNAFVYIAITLYLLNVFLPIAFAIKIKRSKTKWMYPNFIRIIK